MRTVEAKGRTVDEAVINGLNELGISKEDARIEVIEEGSNGFLGLGKRPAIVKNRRNY